MNQEEFVSIIKDNQSLIYKICNSYCKAQDRKDLEQEILIQLWRSLEKYDGRVKISTWIYKIALNTAISHYRKDLKAKNRTHDVDLYLFSNCDYDFDKDEKLKLLYQFIEELKSLDKALILLYLDGYKYEEIANIIGISKTNVATKLNRIKANIKKKYLNKK